MTALNINRFDYAVSQASIITLQLTAFNYQIVPDDNKV
jgi:hypothetical protein